MLFANPCRHGQKTILVPHRSRTMERASLLMRWQSCPTRGPPQSCARPRSCSVAWACLAFVARRSLRSAQHPRSRSRAVRPAALRHIPRSLAAARPSNSAWRWSSAAGREQWSACATCSSTRLSVARPSCWQGEQGAKRRTARLYRPQPCCRMLPPSCCLFVSMIAAASVTTAVWAARLASTTARNKLLPCRVQKEIERCRETVFRLGLVRPGVTFTLYDKGRKSFLLRLIKVRCICSTG